MGQSYVQIRLRKQFWLKYKAVTRASALNSFKVKFILFSRKKVIYLWWLQCWVEKQTLWITYTLYHPSRKTRRIAGCNELYQAWVMPIHIMMSLGPYLSNQGPVCIGHQSLNGEESRWRVGKPSCWHWILYTPALFHVPTHPPVKYIIQWWLIIAVMVTFVHMPICN